MYAQGSTSRAFFEARRSRRKDTDTATCITTHAKKPPPPHDMSNSKRQEHEEHKERPKRASPTRGRRQKDEPLRERKTREAKTRHKEEAERRADRAAPKTNARGGKPSLQTQLPAKKKEDRKRGLKLRPPSRSRKPWVPQRATCGPPTSLQKEHQSGTLVILL